MCWVFCLELRTQRWLNILPWPTGVHSMISKKDIETSKLQDEKYEKMQWEEEETKIMWPGPGGQRVSWCLAKRNKWEVGMLDQKQSMGKGLIWNDALLQEDGVCWVIEWEQRGEDGRRATGWTTRDFESQVKNSRWWTLKGSERGSGWNKQWCCRKLWEEVLERWHPVGRPIQRPLTGDSCLENLHC